MSVEKLLEINCQEMPIVVTTSPDLIKQLAQRVNIKSLKIDVTDAIQEHLEITHHKFSPDKSEKRLSRLELFLFDYHTPSMPLIDEVHVHVEPPAPLEGEGKSGWENNFFISRGVGSYWFFIQNGYYFLS